MLGRATRTVRPDAHEEDELGKTLVSEVRQAHLVLWRAIVERRHGGDGCAQLGKLNAMGGHGVMLR